jgi:hypothetical protein
MTPPTTSPPPDSHVEWLHQERLINKGHLTALHRHIINNHLTETEIQALISIRDKFGEGSLMYSAESADVF